MQIVSALFAGLRVLPARLLGEHPLPPPLRRCIGVLAIERARHLHATPSIGEISSVCDTNADEMLLERLLERLGQHGHAVFGALAVAHGDLAAIEVQVLHAQAQALGQPQPRAVQHRCHEPHLAVEFVQHRRDLLRRHDHGHMSRFSSADHVAQITQRTVEYISVKKEQSGQCLVLRRGADLLLHGQMREERVDLRLAHLVGVANVVETDVALHPLAVRLLRSRAVMARLQSVVHAVHELGRFLGHGCLL